jgi:tRNA-specific 2-thiouridylase
VGERVIVAMSGGVDSSVAAYLLLRDGYEVIGMTLKTWPKELCDTVPKGQTCCSSRDIEDARRVAYRLGIPFYVVEASEPFRRWVIDDFVRRYGEGETPNPCVVCNRTIKLGLLLQKAKALQAQWVATGHYARVIWDERRGRYAIRQAVDEAKDQSYVLFQLTQDQLRRLKLPLGDLPKSEVRQIAREIGLEVADKPESMELCFIPDGDTQGFLRQYAPYAFRPGALVDVEGRVLGTHRGIAAYTVGQRKGIGLARPFPLYVLKLDPRTNQVVVGERQQLAVRSCRVGSLFWCAIPELRQPQMAWVKIRYRTDKIPARICPIQDGEVQVEFCNPVEGGVSPGQACVFYEEDVVLGGGWIKPEP